MKLSGKVAVITGGGGLLGRQHAAALAEHGCRVVLLDIDGERLESGVRDLQQRYSNLIDSCEVDITNEAAVAKVNDRLLREFGGADILINNAARNPKVEAGEVQQKSRLEVYSLEDWRWDLEVGLTGAMLCSRVFGASMATRQSGVILNVASDLSVMGPDQRIYREEGLPLPQQPVKPVSYSVVKSGLIGLTRYLATYWAESGVRVNAISPGGVYNDQPDEFVSRLERLIPLGRMARVDEYQAAVVFLCSDDSSYMTGQNLVIDGGRSCW